MPERQVSNDLMRFEIASCAEGLLVVLINFRVSLKPKAARRAADTRIDGIMKVLN